jgi:predicted  nucleic acid-binding Zn-ribbon protein
LNIYTKELVKLSKIDNSLDSFNPQINEINAKVEKAKKEVDNLKSQASAIEELIDGNNAKITSFEEQIKVLKDQLEDIKKKQPKLKTEKEIASLSSEEHIAKDPLQYDNEEIDRLNKINEVKRAELDDIEQQLKDAEANLEEVVKSIESEVAQIEEQKASLYKDRETQTVSMDSKILAFYEKIRKWAGNSAIIKVENQACYGCYIKINDKTYSDLIKGEDIVSCPHCGRVLYIEEDSESAQEEA